MSKILIVEDKANNVEIFSRLLQRSGFEITSAGTKEDALNAAREQAPDLILMDIRMPMFDGGEESQTAGLEAAAELKADEATAGIPVIALTGDAMRDFRSRMIEAGFCDYIEKPVTDYTQFVATIKKRLGEGDAV